jgi:hypothetical protein
MAKKNHTKKKIVKTLPNLSKKKQDEILKDMSIDIDISHLQKIRTSIN